jgi:hypothetical protein
MDPVNTIASFYSNANGAGTHPLYVRLITAALSESHRKAGQQSHQFRGSTFERDPRLADQNTASPN